MDSGPFTPPENDVADQETIAVQSEPPNSPASILKRKRSVFDSGSRSSETPKQTGTVPNLKPNIVKRVQFKEPLSEFHSAPTQRAPLLNLDDPFKFGLSTIQGLRKWIGDLKVSEIATLLVEHGSEDMAFVDVLEEYVRRRDEDL